ncbi:hypothetical protein FIBSPDRAFT_872631 [Athelia psychrophila]|uniref:Uncharacterized protein n=1 Tax=Athelia psychrophila TaxID=1759441 RepID=A0A165ZC61_9AGAM|nr:hypothetical protein FIBSPDRAFT_872631 [Fibularhizoctonia sp. CBS 109695]
MESVYAPLHNQWALLHSPYPPALLAQIKQARRECWANKTRKLERERRGEMVARRCDMLARMGEEE